jgi:hypothetical protein
MSGKRLARPTSLPEVGIHRIAPTPLAPCNALLFPATKMTDSNDSGTGASGEPKPISTSQRILDFLKANKDSISTIQVILGIVGTGLCGLVGYLIWITVSVRGEIASLKSTVKDDVVKQVQDQLATVKQELVASTSDAKSAGYKLETLVWLLRGSAALSSTNCRGDYQATISEFTLIKGDRRFALTHTDNDDADPIREEILQHAMIAFARGGRFALVSEKDLESFRVAVEKSRDQPCAHDSHLAYCKLLLGAKRFEAAKKEVLAGMEQLVTTRKPVGADCAGCGAIGEVDIYTTYSERYIGLLILADVASRAASEKPAKKYLAEGEIVDAACRKLAVNYLALDALSLLVRTEYFPLIRHLAIQDIPSLPTRIDQLVSEWSGLGMMPALKQVPGPLGKETVERVYSPTRVRPAKSRKEPEGEAPAPRQLEPVPVKEQDTKKR